MKKSYLILITFLVCLSYTSCFKDKDDEIQQVSDLEVQNFIYKGLNLFYLYKSDIPDLADNKFKNQKALNSFLSNYESPQNLFDHLIADQDRFSILVPDFRELENSLNGITKNNGMEFGLVRFSKSDNVFGYVRYVLPETSAAEKGVKRGMLFNRVDDTQLTAENFRKLLLNQETYTIGLAKLNGNQLAPIDQNITLTKAQYSEDPIYLSKTLTIENHKIGYLMYNGFINSYDDELNRAFADFKSNAVSDLVIDLRYNGGGSVETCNDLCTMITGQFKDELFITEQYNANFKDDKRFFNDELNSKAKINSLGLDRVYVLTTESTASASELLISGLMPYIDVVQIGTTTTGKFQASITVYDSDDFLRKNVKPGHDYAMQPLILKSVNADGFTDYGDGIEPEVSLEEDLGNLGTLGSPDEPYLQKAIQLITGNKTNGKNKTESYVHFQKVGDSKMNETSYQRMYLDKQ